MAHLDPTRPIRCYIHHLYAHHEDPCRGRYILLMIHPDVHDLRRAAERYDRRGDRGSAPPGGYEDTLGIFHPTPYRSRYDRKQRQWIDTTTAFAGVMRLALTHLDLEIFAHEATHLATHLTRLHMWSKPGADPVCNLGDNCDPAEEAFAYLLGGVVSELAQIVADVRARTK